MAERAGNSTLTMMEDECDREFHADDMHVDDVVVGM
jgi:hypothetical protein